MQLFVKHMATYGTAAGLGVAAWSGWGANVVNEHNDKRGERRLVGHVERDEYWGALGEVREPADEFVDEIDQQCVAARR